MGTYQNNKGSYTDDKNIPYMNADITEIIVSKIISSKYTIIEIYYKDRWLLIETVFDYSSDITF